MKLLILLCLVVLAGAAPPPKVNYPQDVQILRSEYDSDGFGTYNWVYEQTDGQAQVQQGELRNAGTKDEYITVKGSYTWVGPDGITYRVVYVADEKGYQPEIEEGPGGAIPPAVVASLLG
ncbi:endocuticle structural glycoprotein SgAbd-5-like [Melitaea cinxia]|uniref:endocuticle structural glycoprotein SgAbd-5-like n=1 Tax=Melitaea cinxia TaxID=113334 RepID=UPI001E26FB09|nr:endocuticle structural glycoprotein SgAbd-5-like [Melitaea cinxia]